MTANEFVQKANEHHIPSITIGSSTEFTYLTLHTFNNGFKKVRILEESRADGSSTYQYVDKPASDFLARYKDHINSQHCYV